MDPKFLSPYNPEETEGRIYQLWLDLGVFDPDICVKKGYTKADAEPYLIVMPPPNVTGVLHMGHALMITIEDILIRFARMSGKRTLWLPGTDHAAIATQAKVEKDIYKKEKRSRHDIGRDELLRRIERFAKESHDTIVEQIKVTGASCDWSREAFTLDEVRTKAVRTMFKKMYDDGLVYRGQRIVNWDPKGQTTISDDEIVYKEEGTTFYTFKYGPFEIATARPETKFGDKYVVMHPDDKRYTKYKNGEKFELEWINGPITATVVKDPAIDMAFGTGVMTITPWHSMVDFEIAERHNLDKEQIIDTYGRLLSIAGEFAGKKISEARALIVEKMRAKGLVVKEEAYTHNVATAERTGGLIEPQIMKQWFVAVNKEFTLPYSAIPGIASGSKTTLKEIMRKVVESRATTIIPEHFEKTYFHWIDNLRDWCISRQIWYGHRIPVWYRSTKLTAGQNDEVYAGVEAPDGEGWDQDPDTLDTWFSSGLWTFSTLGWPEKTKDLETYHLTTVLETGYEILFFWVARMILMTGYALGTIPFRTVYLHGTVRDAHGRKMSKSLGNGIDPIDIAKKFGADAGRMALIIGNTPGTDTRISEDKVKAYKYFANKLWNISRFVLTAIEGTDLSKPPALGEKDRAILDELTAIAKDITEDIEAYRFYIAGEKIYHYVWHTFADKILEECKPRFTGEDPADKLSAQYMLFMLLEKSLVLLHPFMPFITEEIWQSLPDRKRPLIVTPYDY
ncbi:MAG: valine--tRNA ligase [Candidatus Lloydbacteria bacterium RIFCSPLOWO2_01_FULL_50_20]|uniref:Valine--tRNA ligase n=1 Tax=Candidatus Lloydbacteria bacterium RIFCSPLOWO2_01_FULL_50_20 TaxID=1798665 RepID=A0A1G2DKS7_9BACT|nr:MAG: valine--tRNA ligase [Candidatus Lloydbacteria bacterium RIFCSPHIGHO2_02_FULL_50_11]OGZ13418.1 MAG: valine--tRNA ligase [Candidatus Lloydbacteria bacterium RIFCSPLOWO2_01_FULL_50_20]